MKKRVALLLSICLTFSMSSAAFAADVASIGLDEPAVEEDVREEIIEKEDTAISEDADEVLEEEISASDPVKEDAVTEPEAEETAAPIEETEQVAESITETVEDTEENTEEPAEEPVPADIVEQTTVPEEVSYPDEIDVIEAQAPEEADNNDEVNAASIHVDKDSGIAYEDITLGIYVGEEDGMFPTSGKNSTIGAYTIRWKSSNTKVATVSGGIIKGVSAGRAVITGTAIATKTGKEYRYATRRYTVFGELKSFDLPNYTVYAGIEKEVIIKTTPNDSIINGVEAKTDNAKIARVLAMPEDVPGNTNVVCYIVGVVPGTTKLHVTMTSEKGTVSKTSTITVKRLLSLDKPSYTLYKGRTRKLVYTINDNAYKNEPVEWRSSNTDVATVLKDGTVRALANGTATITCSLKSNPDVKAACKITVKTPVSGITLNRANATVLMGYTFALKATVAPSSASNKAVEWTTSDRRVASVDENGVIRGVAKGKATITCTAKDGSGKKATCAVTVKIPVYSITLNRAAATMTKGKVFQLKATIEPSLADNKAVTWKSSNTAVVTVDSTGRMTGVGKGTTVVTCTAKDGSGVKATCKVTGK